MCLNKLEVVIHKFACLNGAYVVFNSTSVMLRSLLGNLTVLPVFIYPDTDTSVVTLPWATNMEELLPLLKAIVRYLRYITYDVNCM